jgi:hypothetical protein
MLEPLRDEAYFARVFLEFGARTDVAERLRHRRRGAAREMAAAGELTRAAAE